MERIEMSKKEINWLEVLGRVQEGHTGPAEAARMLGLSERQVRRLRRVYEREGAAGLVRQRRGKPSNHHLPYLLRGDELLPFKVFDTKQADLSPLDDKALNARMDNIAKGRNTVHKPAPTTPWRNYQAPITPSPTG